jgi:hypothetical protein
VLVALARLIRALHEASAGWVPPPDAVWGGTPANLGRPTAPRTEISGEDPGFGEEYSCRRLTIEATSRL